VLRVTQKHKPNASKEALGFFVVTSQLERFQVDVADAWGNTLDDSSNWGVAPATPLAKLF
jgi:hypothetical protein